MYFYYYDKPPWPQKCSPEAKNWCRYRKIQIRLIWSMYFSECHFEKCGKNESFLITHFHCQNYLLKYVTVLLQLLTHLPAIVLARKFLYIIILLKLAFSTYFLIFFFLPLEVVEIFASDKGLSMHC